jgi:hippurate hydrolase
MKPFPLIISSAATLLLALTAPAAVAALDVDAAKSAIERKLDADYPRLDALYKDLHRHPEVGYQETATAARLAKEMRALGFTVTEGVGKTGIVAILHNGAGPTILVRTELDALPLQELTGLPYASTDKQTVNGHETYVAHMCGHDIHMAVWVGTARELVELKARWQGTLMFIGQPAEELVSGAKAMLDDGLFTRFPKPDFGFALHVGPEAYDHVGYRAGVISSNSDAFEIVFHGRGGHGAMPNLTIDPVLEAARFTVDVQSIVSREKDPAAFGVISVGALEAGNAGNVIPDTARLRGTIRSYDATVRAKLGAGIDRTAKAVAAMADAPAPDLTIKAGGIAIVNDTALTERTAAVFKTAFGAHAEPDAAPGAASEDYSRFIIAGVPSTYFSLGGLDPAMLTKAHANGTPVPANHSPYFAPVPEPTIRMGVEAMTLAILNVVSNP